MGIVIRVISFLWISFLSWKVFSLEHLRKPPRIFLDGKNGATVDGGATWDSDSIRGKLCLFFYVDPDEKDLNDDLAKKLEAENFDHDHLTSYAAINMAATWKPNAIINIVLKQKQKEHPHTIYLRDFDKVFVKEWKLKDDSYDVILFNELGEPIWIFEGKVPKEKGDELIVLVRANIARLKDRIGKPPIGDPP